MSPSVIPAKQKPLHKYLLGSKKVSSVNMAILSLCEAHGNSCGQGDTPVLDTSCGSSAYPPFCNALIWPALKWAFVLVQMHVANGEQGQEVRGREKKEARVQIPWLAPCSIPRVGCVSQSKVTESVTSHRPLPSPFQGIVQSVHPPGCYCTISWGCLLACACLCNNSLKKSSQITQFRHCCLFLHWIWTDTLVINDHLAL